MTALLPALIATAIIAAIQMARRARGRRRANGALLLRHHEINRHHLRNGGALWETLACVAFVVAGHVLVLVVWAIATALMSFQEPRW